MNLRPRFAHFLLGSMLAASGVLAQPVSRSHGNGGGREVTLNLKDADINTLIATVSEVTGKNFIIDPRVKGKVTVISSSPMNAAGVYETFLSVLQVNGFAAIPAGDAVKITLEANARTDGGSYVGSGSGLADDEIVTHVYEVRNASAQQLVAMLRPLVAQSGQLAAYTGSNSLIISDRASNVLRVERLIRAIDVAGDRDVQLIPLKNAAASDVVRTLTTLAQQSKQADPTAQQTAVIADDRSNSVLIAGPKGDRDRMISVIADLDAPTAEKGGDTQVIFLKFADAESLAAILQGNTPASKSKSSGGSMFGSSSGSGSGSSGFGSSNSSFGSSSSAASTPAPTSSSSSSSVSGGGGNNPDLHVIADKDQNALVITAPPKIMQKVRNVIDQLDIRRSQVLVEGIIAEVSATKTSSLGVDYIAYDPSTVAAAGLLNSSTVSALQNASSLVSSSTSTSLSSTSTTSLIASAASSVLGTGGTALVGSFKNGHLFGALLKALQSDGDTNILSTPSLVTLDNEEAKFEVGQEVPFQTGSYSNTGTSSNGSVNPFQTIDRKDVGLKLGITPTIGGEGDNIRLKIEFENSSLSSGTAGSSDLVTNKRTLSNTVSIDGGQILVIGGLIDDQITDTQNRIPLLSDLPVVGALFRSRDISKMKRNLMIFIHPVILRTHDEGDFYTRRKYDGTREAQVRAANGAIPLIGGQRPMLYRYDDYVREANRPATASDASPPKNGPPGAAPANDPSASPVVPPLDATSPPPLPVPEVAPESAVLPNSAIPR